MSIPPGPLSGKGGDAGSAAIAASGLKHAPPWGGRRRRKSPSSAPATPAWPPPSNWPPQAGRSRCSKPRAPSAVAPARRGSTASTVDNGQHILVGAYTETLRLMHAVGADPDALLKRTPLRFEFPGEFLMSAPRLAGAAASGLCPAPGAGPRLAREMGGDPLHAGAARRPIPHRARHQRDEVAGRQRHAVPPAPTLVGAAVHRRPEYAGRARLGAGAGQRAARQPRRRSRRQRPAAATGESFRAVSRTRGEVRRTSAAARCIAASA